MRWGADGDGCTARYRRRPSENRRDGIAWLWADAPLSFLRCFLPWELVGREYAARSSAPSSDESPSSTGLLAPLPLLAASPSSVGPSPRPWSALTDGSFSTAPSSSVHGSTRVARASVAVLAPRKHKKPAANARLPYLRSAQLQGTWVMRTPTPGHTPRHRHTRMHTRGDTASPPIQHATHSLGWNDALYA